MKKLILSLCIVSLLSACKKEITELPGDTQTGANTFGAKINGELWGPQGFGPFPADNILVATIVGNDIRIEVQNFASSPNETGMYIYLTNVLAPGTYPLNTTVSHPTTSASYAFYVKRRLSPLSEWITSGSKTGSVTVTKIDRTNKIIAGTFEFSANPILNAGDAPLVVTEGRFDIKLK
jgi:hypothetical protein